MEINKVYNIENYFEFLTNITHIDKPDIRFITHHTLTFSVESYYQQIG